VSDWDADPALGCGLMLLVGFGLTVLMVGFLIALVWSKLV
jgi:hypothetical protein